MYCDRLDESNFCGGRKKRSTKMKDQLVEDEERE
jgi:hypothetical protein